MTTQKAARRIDITLTHWIGGEQKIQVDAYIEMDEGYDYFNGDEEVCIQKIESDGDSPLPFYLLAEEMEDIFFRLQAKADKALQKHTRIIA